MTKPSELTDDQVRVIYSRAWAGHPAKDIAEEHKITVQLVSRVKHGQARNDVTKHRALRPRKITDLEMPGIDPNNLTPLQKHIIYQMAHNPVLTLKSVMVDFGITSTQLVEIMEDKQWAYVPQKEGTTMEEKPAAQVYPYSDAYEGPVDMENDPHAQHLAKVVARYPASHLSVVIRGWYQIDTMDLDEDTCTALIRDIDRDEDGIDLYKYHVEDEGDFVQIYPL